MDKQLDRRWKQIGKRGLGYLTRILRFVTKFTGMFWQSERMWDGRFGCIKAVHHRLELDKTDSWLSFFAPYHAGPKAREFEKQKSIGCLSRTLSSRANRAGLAYCLVFRNDGPLHFCLDFRDVNTVPIRDSYPIPCMDEWFDSLDDAKIFST